MRLARRVEQWPIEEWAGKAGLAARRVARRLVRRKRVVALSCAGSVFLLTVVSNALWSQTARHPAPLWGGGDEVANFAAHGDAVSPVRRPTPAGESSSMVLSIQTGLGRLGLYDGALSGVLDSGTVDAISGFERRNGLPVTGEPSLAVLSAVGASAPSTPSVTPAAPVSIGGLTVAQIQRQLNVRGFGPLDEDGMMGPRTAAALRSFATSMGLPVAEPTSVSVIGALAKGGA